MKKLATLVIAPLFCAALATAPAQAAYVIKKETAPAAEEKTISTKEEAVSYFRNLSREERRTRISAVRDVIRDYNNTTEPKKGSASTNTLLLVILAIFIPPLAVYLHQGEINSKFWLDLILTLLFFVPGLIYALILILS